MGQENQEKQIQGLQKRESKISLLAMIQANQKIEISAYLGRFKERGAIKFEKVFEIDNSDRIPALASTESGRFEILVALSASLTSLFSNINLRVGLTDQQLVDIGNLIIDQSYEDQLALEDVLLFFQKFLVGEYGKIYDRMDIPTFFEFFEKYRQNRYEAIRAIREQEHAQYKVSGRGPNLTPPISVNRDEDPANVLDLMQTLYQAKTENKNEQRSNDEVV